MYNTQLTSAMMAIILTTGYLFSAKALGADIDLKGHALFSFTPEDYILQTDRYIYKIAKSGLSSKSRKNLDSASNQRQMVNIKIPRSNITYLWPIESNPAAVLNIKNFQKTAAKFNSEASSHHGRIFLRGNSLFSFSDSFVLVQVNKSIYQVKKSQLTSQQLENINGDGTGERVELSIPHDAIDLVWSFDQSKNREIASVTEPDEVTLNGSNLKLRGTILCSFDEPLLVVQSNGNIFQIQKSKIKTDTPASLDKPGSKIKLSTSISAIKFVWTAAPRELTY